MVVKKCEFSEDHLWEFDGSVTSIGVIRELCVCTGSENECNEPEVNCDDRKIWYKIIQIKMSWPLLKQQS